MSAARSDSGMETNAMNATLRSRRNTNRIRPIMPAPISKSVRMPRSAESMKFAGLWRLG